MSWFSVESILNTLCMGRELSVLTLVLILHFFFLLAGETHGYLLVISIFWNAACVCKKKYMVMAGLSLGL